MNQTSRQPPGQSISNAFEAEHFANATLRRRHIEQLENEITELAAHIHAATYRLLEMIRKYDTCDGWAEPGLRSSATAPALLYLLHPCSRARTG